MVRRPGTKASLTDPGRVTEAAGEEGPGDRAGPGAHRAPGRPHLDVRLAALPGHLNQLRKDQAVAAAGVSTPRYRTVPAIMLS
jgi:hypothetical protein